MMWLRRAMGMQDMEQPPPVRRQTTDIEARFRPPVSPIENNPVGWSSTYAPEVASNASPDFSPLASSAMMTPEQKLGRFWNMATRQAKQGYTNADLPQLTAAGQEAYDAAAGFVNMAAPIGKANGAAINEALAQQFPDVQFYVSAPRNGERLVLDKVVVPPEMRGKGVGSAFMQELTRMADEAGVPMGLTPSDHFGGNVNKLRQFYERFGFSPNTGRSRDLTISDALLRRPK